MKTFFSLSALIMCIALLGCEPKVLEPDFTPPLAPRGLSTATGDGFSEIFWLANPEPDLAGYRVYASYTLEGPYQFIGSTRDHSYVDKGIQNGHTYFYAVSAYDFSGNESDLSHEIVSETPRPEGYSVILKDFRTYPAASGYDFSTETTGPWNDGYSDLFFEYYEGAYYLDVDTDTDIQDMGFTKSLYEIKEAPFSGWSPTKDVRLIIGHTYVIRTWDYHFAKVRIISLSTHSLEFDWAYQLQVDNPRLKIGTPGSRATVAPGPGVLSR